jgi:hypothetical protein
MPIVALDSKEHKNLKVRRPSTYEDLAKIHMLPLVVHECTHAASDYPVVFVKNEETNQFQLVALFGLSPGENLFVSDGKWNALYLPAVIQNNPFRLIPDEEKPDQIDFGLDTDSDLVQETEGEALFDDDGNETDYLQERKESLYKYLEHDRITRAFVSLLSELKLLRGRDLTVNVNGKTINIAGIYTVDEAKLNELPDEKFDDLRKRGFLPVIYAHVFSLNQVRRLAKYRAAA